MPIVTVTKAQLKMGQSLPPGWHKATLKEFGRAPNKKKNGMNLIPVFDVEDEDGDARELKVWFPEKHLGKEFVHFFNAMTDSAVSDDPNDGDVQIEVDKIKESIGASLWVHLSPSVYLGKITSQIDDYLPINANPDEIPFDSDLEV